MTQKDSGVERVVPSDSIDVESILAGWWQEFDGLCRVLHTWQQPDEQGLRDELKELSNVPVCQPSIPINDGQPCLDDLLFFKKPESWNVHNCYEVDKGNWEHDVRVYGENGNNNQRSCLFSRMSVKESALQSCTVGTFDVGHHRQEAEKPCGESSFLTGNGRLKSQHTGIDMEVESASSHAEVHTWIRHAFVRSDTCHEHVFGRSVQKFGSLLRGGRKGNLDLSEPQARAQMHRSESHVKFPSAPNDVWDNGVDPCIESHCNLQSRSDGAGVDVDFSCHFPRTHDLEFEPQPFAVGASDNMMFGQGNIHQARHEMDLPFEMFDSNQSFPYGNEKSADCGIWQDSAEEGSRRHQGGKSMTFHTKDTVENQACDSHLRACKEGNLDLLGAQAEEQEGPLRSGVKGNLDLGSLQDQYDQHDQSQIIESNCSRHVSFNENVDIVCYQQEDAYPATIRMVDQARCCRSLWHMHGQITDINGFLQVLAGFDLEDSYPISPEVNGQSNQEDEFVNHEGQNVGDTHEENFDNELQMVADEIQASRLPIFADTWFLATNRFQVCVRPREMRLKSSFLADPMQLERDCRKMWRELDNGGPVTLQVLGGLPTRRSAIKLHIVIMQDPSPRMDTTIFHSESLPPLFKYRAVMFPRGINVNTFFEMAQVEGACHVGVKACYTRCWESGEEILKSNLDRVWVPSNRYIEGDIRIVDDVVQLDSEESDQGSEASTWAGSQADSVESDESFLMSGGPPLFQLDDYMQHMWETAGMEDVDMQDEVQDHIEQVQSDILYAPQHLGHLHDEIDRLRDLQNEDGSEWTAATFGLGLVDLGRRDVRFNPFNLRGLLETILRTWSDHSHYGNVVVYNVHPQPVDFLGPRTVAVLVVIEMPESRDVTTRNVLVVEQAAADVGARPQPYGARLTCAASEREILAQLQLHHHCPPFALRPCHVRLGEVILEKGQFYDFDHGSLCRTWIGNVHSKVLQAEQAV